MPVTTTALPTRFCGASLTATLPNSTPAARNFLIIAICDLSANQLAIFVAITSPTPSISLNCSGVASIIASSEPNRLDKDSAAAGPRFLIPRPTSNFANGRDFESAIAFNKFFALNSAKPSSCNNFSSVSEYKSPISETKFLSESAKTVFSPRPSISIAPRDAK